MNLFSSTLEALFPRFCYLCYAKTTGLVCDSCKEKLMEKRVSKTIFPRESRLSKVHILFDYSEGVRTLVEQFKYERRREIVNYLMAFYDFSELMYDCIVPVPLHHVRFRERGFNQSELIAKNLVQFTHIPIVKRGVQRVRYTKQQTGLQKEERNKNLLNAFKIRSPERFQNKRVLLVDDVYTTGSTLENLAKAFRGFPSCIDGFVLASKA